MSDFKTKTITYFTKPGLDNTDKAIELALKRIEEGDIKKVVVATSTGTTGLKVAKAFKGTPVEVIAVFSTAGTKFDGEEKTRNKNELEKLGIRCVQSTYPLSGIERAVNERWNSAGPALMISDALRLSCEGFKVAIEITLMASDAGLIPPDENILTISGTSRGSDTVLVVKPSYSHKLFDAAIREIICKPLTEGIKHKAV